MRGLIQVRFLKESQEHEFFFWSGSTHLALWKHGSEQAKKNVVARWRPEEQNKPVYSHTLDTDTWLSARPTETRKNVRSIGWQ